MTILTGSDAINYAEANDIDMLHKYADPTEDARDVTIDEAREIAREDGSLIWVERTIADQIAELFDNDGTCWRARHSGTVEGFAVTGGVWPEGSLLGDVLEAVSIDYHFDGERSLGRYRFRDGSVITTSDGGWDNGYWDCFCWAGAGHDDDCDAR